MVSGGVWFLGSLLWESGRPFYQIVLSWAGVLNGTALVLFIIMTLVIVLAGIIREKQTAA